MLPGYADIWIWPRKTGSYEDEICCFAIVTLQTTEFWHLTLSEST